MKKEKKNENACGKRKRLKDVQISIRGFLTAGIILMILTISMLLLFAVNILAEGAVRSYIRSDLSRQLRRNSKNITMKNGKVEFSEELSDRDTGIYFILLDRSGEVWAGEYPEEIPEEEIPGAIVTKGKAAIVDELLSLTLGEKDYYLLDRVQTYLTRTTGKTVLFRCLAEKSAVSSPFQVLWRMCYLSIPVILAVAILFSTMLARMVSRPIGQLCRVAENIRNNNDLSQRTDYHGRFREIGILSEANNRMLDKLEEVFQSQKRFNSDVAHELRTPMAIILAQCEAVRDQNCTEQEYREAFEVIDRQARRTNDVVQQLLRLSRLEQAGVVLEKEFVNLEDIVQSVCEEEELKADRDVEFRFSLQEVSASVDVTLMTILLQNLVHNAVKYSEGKALVEIRLFREEDRICICVKDHGCGIGEKEQEFIFEPFYQVHKNGNTGGFGLGLSIVDRIARLHGGNVTVRSRPGEGSEFTLSIPDKQ